MTETEDPATVAHLLVRVLAFHDISVSPRRALEACRGQNDEGLVAGLRLCGVDARHVKIGEGGVFRLPPSSIVRRHDGSLASVLSNGPSDVRLEDAEGRVFDLRRGAPVGLRREAIAIRPVRAKTGTFGARLLDTLRLEPTANRSILLVLAMGSANVLLGLAAAAFTRLALNDAITERATTKLSAIAIALVAALVHLAWAGWIRHGALLYIETKLAEGGVDGLVRHLLGLSLVDTGRLDVGLVAELAGVAQSSSTQSVTIAGLFTDSLVAAGALAFLFWVDGTSGVLAAGGLVLMLGGAFAVGRRAKRLRSDAIEASRSQRQAMFETVDGVETVRAEAAEERMIARWTARMTKLQSLLVKEQDQTNLLSVVTSGIERLVFAAVLLLLANRALRGDAQLGDVVSAVQACAAFFVSAQTIARLPVLFAALRAQVDRIDVALAIPSRAMELPSLATAPPLEQDALVFRNVGFRYDASAPWVLRDVSFKVRRGGRERLTWPSGAGKSTLLRLASGLVEPGRGDVLVFGLEATRARHLVAYVPQNAMLLPVPITENLRILSRGASLERIALAAEATGLTELLRAFPMSFETPVAPGAANLSSGQRQLILFTAAVASAAPLLLLDETFSNMDRAMRRRLVGMDLMKDRTVLSVLHEDGDSPAALPVRRSDIDVDLVFAPAISRSLPFTPSPLGIE